MLVNDMKLGTVFRGPNSFWMRISHPQYNCVDLRDGWMDTLLCDYETVEHRIEWNEGKTQGLEASIGCCYAILSTPRLKVAGGNIDLETGCFTRGDACVWLNSHRLVIC